MVAFLIGVIFFAAAVICVGKIFAVKNINVTLITYAEDYSDSYGEAKSSLEVLKGETILFLSEENVKKSVSEERYTLTGFEKLFPGTLNITLKERPETFAVTGGGLYYMYDDDGKYLKGRVETENINTDGHSNVELIGVAPEQVEYVARIAANFKENFKILRSAVESISIDTRPGVEGYTDKLTFKFHSGLNIQLDTYYEYTNDKISAAYAEYCKLSDREKLCGTIRSYRLGGAEGVINADYSLF